MDRNLSQHTQWARTKIVATVGPACSDPEVLADLVRAGADVFRINMAHGTAAEHQAIVERVREVSARLGQPAGVLVDLAGPKFRLGEIVGESVHCDLGAEFAFVTAAPQTPHELTTNYEPLLRELSVGDQVLLADGNVSMRVTKASKSRVEMRVEHAGIIRSRQGINLPGVRVSAPAISVEDHQNAIWAAKAGADFVSLSFVRSPDEVRTLKDIVRSSGSDATIIAKIEKREALDRLEEIVTVADGIMVARGDLGVEIDVAQIPIEQKRVVRTCHRLCKPVIIATEMLDSMQDSPRPTRAEATDVANAILDGADACMLSGETAIGSYPREAVAMMNRIALATEASMKGRPLRDMSEGRNDGLQEVTRAVVRGAGVMAQVVGAKLVVVASFSGRTALALSQQRSFAPTVGVSSNEATLRKMCLYWGVTPLAGAPACNVEQLIRHADEWACERGMAQPGDRIVIVGGSHLTAGTAEDDEMAEGVHDIVIVHEVEGPQREA